MPIHRLLVANRGEIAIRIMRAAAELQIETIAVYSEDDARCLHVRKADQAVPLKGTGATAYLDGAQIIAAAKAAGADAVHPGYGFLAENAGFAEHCSAAAIVFVGPTPASLSMFGDKGQAKALASRCGVPIIPGTAGSTSLDNARAFLAALQSSDSTAAVMLKAIAGGGGRGMRIVRSLQELDAAYTRCASEAQAAFGNGDLYVEEYWPKARHVEVQILGDGVQVVHLHERECSLQRRQQKIIEVAPATALPQQRRTQLHEAALTMARSADYRSLGTFEFLVTDEQFAFIEANPRLQVEHTVTEAVTGIDLVQAQLQIAGGANLRALGLEQAHIPAPRGVAIQLRINMETLDAQANALPSGGTLRTFDMPSGPGIRVDSFGYAGYATSPRFDSLLAKLIVHSPNGDFATAAHKARRALAECQIEGLQTNLGLLSKLLQHPEVIAQRVYTRFLEEHIGELRGADNTPRLYFDAPATSAGASPSPSSRAGARLASTDPLAVLTLGKSAQAESSTGNTPNSNASYSNALAIPVSREGPEGTVGVPAPLQGTIVTLDVQTGDRVRAGQQLLVMEAMKMEHVVTANESGEVQSIAVSVGDAVFQGHVLLFIEPLDVIGGAIAAQANVDIDHIRPDLQEVIERHAYGMDENRPDAVARRRKTKQRTVRENVDDLLDPGTLIEYGAMVIAGQRRRRALQDLIERTPGDGMVCGIGHVNGALFDDEHSRCIVMSYDYTVLAGTQGGQNHRKKDRMFEIAQKSQLPVVFFTEGGGGRPGDTDGSGVAGLDCLAFTYFAELSGLVPLIGITSGRCFAGNAALLGCCDVVIATEGSNIGMGGPAMIEGGGLGVFRPEEVGPLREQVSNGVVDIAVADEAEAVRVAKQYLSYFQGARSDWQCVDQRLLRNIIPEQRLRVYDVRKVIETMADTGSVLELRQHFGLGMVTAFARIEGRPIGIVANNPNHLAGAIDSDNADKAARFMQLCDAFDIPILFLCDTPGIMVGPEVEKTALVRHAARMFVTSASLTVPFFTIVLRKSYGLGAQAMAGGSFRAPLFAVSWPTGEFGGMGLEGAVKLGYRNELAAIDDPQERKRSFEEMVARSYERGKAVNVASHFELDDVIDPYDSRRWIASALRASPKPLPRAGKKRPCIDTW